MVSSWSLRLSKPPALTVTVSLPGSWLEKSQRASAAAPPLRRDPFTLGVASGDPQPHSVLLWTRLAPRPYEENGGLPAERVTVHWELARDPRFRRVVRRGTAPAHPEFNHSVHVEVDHVDADRTYYFRFRAGKWVSETGRTRTAPPASSRTGLTLAAVSCQAYHDGYFTAYRHLAEDDVDVVFHLGDYLYEYGNGADRSGPPELIGIRDGIPATEILNLADYPSVGDLSGSGNPVVIKGGLTVDVGGIDGVTYGDEFVLIGEQGGARITADDVAVAADAAVRARTKAAPRLLKGRFHLLTARTKKWSRPESSSTN